MTDTEQLILESIKDLKLENNKGHNAIISHQKETNGKVKENTEARLEMRGALGIIKWILGFVGVGTATNILMTLFY